MSEDDTLSEYVRLDVIAVRLNLNHHEWAARVLAAVKAIHPNLEFESDVEVEIVEHAP